jgi:DNA-binding transcriptional LysR family regulator
MTVRRRSPPLVALRAFEAAGRLVAPFGFAPSGLSMYVLYPKSRVHNLQITAFRDWLVEAGTRSTP